MNPQRNRRKQGVALLITMVLILLIGVIALTSIDHSGNEMIAGARGRSTARAPYAADGGIQLALAHVAENPPNTDAIDIDIGTYNVESRTRAEVTPQSIESLGEGAPLDGYGINEGSGYVSELFMVDITSVGPNQASTGIQSKLYMFDADIAGY